MLRGEYAMGFMDNTSFSILQKSLDATWYKQKIISQNIANDSTPGYKAKTVNFGLVLKDKCKCSYHPGEQESGIELTTTVTEEQNTQQTLDGNNVDIEKEATALADAQLQYSTLIDKMNNEFSMIRTAIQK